VKAALLHKIGDIRLEDVPDPKPGAGEVLVKMGAVGICGSDVHYYVDGKIGSAVVTKPLILGHEPAGTVVEHGEGVDGPPVGTRVAVEPGWPCGKCEFCKEGRYNVCPHMHFLGMPPDNTGAYAEYLVVPADYVFPIPDNLTLEHGSLIEPLAVGVHAAGLAKIKPGQTAAVLGEGSIGMCTTACAKLAGALTVYGMDLHDYRLDAARDIGADVTFNADKENVVEKILDATNGRGVDVVFEAAGSPATPQQAIDIVKPGGTAIMIGICQEQPLRIDVSQARRKELVTIQCRRFCNDFPTAIALAASGKVNLDRMATHRYPLENLAEAFETVRNYQDGVIKATVMMEDE
jgi:L-iditol 2-dehydrogenase